MSNIKDKAIDNLWITTDDTKSYKITLPPVSRLLNEGSVFSEGSKVTGNITYFVPRDANGNVTGSPMRLLRDAKGNFIDANVVAPYYENILENKSKWEAIGGQDLIKTAEEKLGVSEAIVTSGAEGMRTTRQNKTTIAYGANSDIDLLDSNRLDENVSGIYGYGGQNLMRGLDKWALQYGADGLVAAKTPSAYGANGQTLVPIYNRADGRREHKHKHEHEKIKYPLKQFGVPPQPMEDLGVDGKHNKKHKHIHDKIKFPHKQFGVPPQPMEDLGFDGRRHRAKMVDMRLGAMPHGNPEAQFDIQFGVDANNVDIQSNVIATPHNVFNVTFGADGDTSKQLYNPDEVASLHASSGTKKSLLDWLQSDSAAQIFNTVSKVSDVIKTAKSGGVINLGKNAGGGNTGAKGGNAGGGSKNPPPKTVTKIAGMTPITFGIVAFGLIAVASIVTVVMMRRGKAKQLANTAKLKTAAPTT